MIIHSGFLLQIKEENQDKVTHQWIKKEENFKDTLKYRGGDETGAGREDKRNQHIQLAGK